MMSDQRRLLDGLDRRQPTDSQSGVLVKIDLVKAGDSLDID
jgi:hypothetical protein